MGKVGFANVSETTVDQKHQLGAIYEQDEVVYQYVHANGSIAQYNLVTLDKDFEAADGTTTTSGARPTRCGVAQVAFADNEYGWVPIGPFPHSAGFLVNAAANCAGNVKLYTTATDGVVDDSATDLVEGLVLTETITTARAATCEAVKRLLTNCQD